MADLIYRQDAIDTHCAICPDKDKCPDGDFICPDRELFRMIKPAYPERPKIGKWIDMGDFEQCSVCTGTHLKEFQTYYGKATWIKTPYCPHCGTPMQAEERGAKMEGGK